MNKSLKTAILFSLISYTLIAAFFIYHEFTENQYRVQVTKCNGDIDTLNFSTRGCEEVIHISDKMSPVLQIGKMKFIDVCEYKILSKSKIK